MRGISDFSAPSFTSDIRPVDTGKTMKIARFEYRSSNGFSTFEKGGGDGTYKAS